MSRVSASLTGVFLSLLLAACSPPSAPPAGSSAPATDAAPPVAPPRFEIVGTYPMPGEALTDRLVVYFNEEIAVSGEPLSLRPAVDGAQSSSGRNHLMLTFDQDLLLPGQYTVTLDDAFRSAAGAPLSPPESPLVFTVSDSRPPVVAGMRAVAGEGDGVMLELAFTRPMDLASLQEKVSVTDGNGEPVPVSLAAGDDPHGVLAPLPAEVALPVTLTVDAGAASLEGPATTKPQSFTHPAETVEVFSARLAESDAENLRILFTMTHDVNVDEVRPLLTVMDASGAPVAADVQAAEQRTAFIVTLPATAATPLQIQMAKGLKSEGAEMVLDYALTYPTSELTVTETAWNTSDGVSRLTLGFSEPIRWAAIGDFLTLTDAATGQSIAREGTTSEEESVTFELYGVDLDMRTLALALKPGLQGLNLGLLSQAYTTEISRELPELNLEYSDWYERGKSGVVLYLNLNQRVDVTSLREAVRFDPPVEDLTVTTAYGDAYYVGGNFDPETDYLLYISTKVKTPDGRAIITEDLELPLSQTPEGQPGVGFDFEDRFYFPRRTQGVLPLVARNVDEVGVRVSQLFPSNIAVALDELSEGKTYSSLEYNWAKLVAEKTVPVQGAQGKGVTVPLDLNDVIPADARGVFGIELNPQPYDYATKIVLWTDLGLMAHWLDDALVVFAHDLFSVAPMPNAKVTLWSSKNQIMGEAQTDERGVARLEKLDTSLGAPTVVVCETESDYTFLQLSPRTDDAVPVNEGMPPYDREGYDAFLYADRNLYRPGETVHAQWIARTYYGDALANVPLQLLVTNPQGAEIRKEAVTLSEFGTGGLDLVTDKTWPTGKYAFTLTVPDAPNPVGTMQVSLEDFVPNRIKTEVSHDGGPWTAKTPYAIQVKAEQLFGGPASNQKAKASVILRKGDFKPEQWAGFSFTNDVDYAPEVVALGEQQTDGAGLASFSYTFPGSKKTTFPIQATVRGEVAEAGARAVSDTKEVLLLPAEPLLGVALASGDDGGVNVDVAAITASGEAAAVSSVTVYLEREDWSYYVRRFADRNEPNFTKSYALVDTRVVPLNEGRGATSFDLGEYSWGYHRVRVESAETPMTASSAFYKMWRGIEVASSPRPSLIKLTLDKESYTPGETATLRIESPFDGQAVVVLQGDTFQQVLTADVVNAAGTVSFAVETGMHPNIWAGVTVVHRAPADRSQVYPYSSFAMVNVPVPDPARKLDVKLTGVPEELRPNTALNVTVEALGSDGANRPVQVTVAAVDEGIHGILDYTDPDPWNYLQRFRSPDHRRAHYYDRVAYDFDAAAIGGDLASRLAKRSTTIGDNWIKPVALWSGPVRTGADGRATVSLAVPEFSGQLRVVAVAADATATGASSAQVFVRRPYMLQTSMPRFVLPGDTFQARATVFNTTGAAVTAKVSWTAGGALASPSGEAALAVPAQDNVGTLAAFEAGATAGQGQMDWRLDVEGAPDESVVQAAPIPVRPPASYQTRHELVVLKPGETRTFLNDGFADDASASLEVSIGADPALRIFNALRYLIGYPYGCVEQTTSACFPLYLMRNSTALLDNVLADQRRIDAYMKTGIDRLFSMQVTSGGLGYWPGARTADRYGSVYALHFLTLIQRDREIELPESSFQRLQDYVRRMCAEGSDQSSSGLYLRAYAHFVLALGGDQQALDQISRFDAVPLPESARYLLAAALAVHTGDVARVREYLVTKPMTPYDTQERGGTLNSEIRSASVKLLALATMNATEEEMTPLVTQITAYLSRPNYGNTQETAFAAAGLGAYFQKLAASLEGSSGTVGGSQGERSFAGKDLVNLKHEGAGGTFTVANTGTGSVYVNVVRAGLPLEPVTEAVSEGGMELARRISTLSGEPVADGRFVQGESYLVALDLKGQAGLENVVVADLLPAGFEIENPRLDANVLAMANISNMATPSYLDIRDDRLVLAFDRLPSSQTQYYYVVRAVTPGTYTHPASSAECMYDPAFRATTTTSTIEVAAP